MTSTAQIILRKDPQAAEKAAVLLFFSVVQRAAQLEL